ncbi:MAG: HEAT repeat domain-containing protein [Candidatus Omnitrophica bacterium]|nr:HEAT repeat domain-containing protein [Candidatus Omnitrophota bacterium]
MAGQNNNDTVDKLLPYYVNLAGEIASDTKRPSHERMDALRVLSRHKGPMVMEYLMRIVDSEKDLNIRQYAGKQLRRLDRVNWNKNIPIILFNKEYDSVLQKDLIGDLESKGGPRAVDFLTYGLKNERPEIRKRAAIALGRLHASREVHILGSLLLKDDYVDVRMAAAVALGTIQWHLETIEYLLQALSEAQNLWVRAQAALTLGLLGDHRGIDWLLELLDHPDDRVWIRAQKALEDLKVPQERIMERMGNILLDDKNRDPARRYLIIALSDADNKYRQWAANKVEEIQSRHANFLTESLSDENYPVRRAAAFALAEKKDHRAVGGVLEVLGDESAEHREQARKYLEESQTPVERFIEGHGRALLHGQNREAKLEAMEALELLVTGVDRHEQRAWREHKLKILTAHRRSLLRKEKEWRAASTNARARTGNMGYARVLGYLRQAALHDPQLGHEAVEALVRVGDTQAAHIFVEALQHPDPIVRETMSNVFKDINDPTIAEGLIDLLAHEDPIVRAYAKQGLVVLGGPQTPKLIEIWHISRDLQDRKDILDSIELHPARAIPSHENLYAMLNYPDVAGQRAALQVLGSLVDDEDAVRAVEAVIVHPGKHKEVREEAVKVLAKMVHPEAHEARFRILESPELILSQWYGQITAPVLHDPRFARYVKDLKTSDAGNALETEDLKRIQELKREFIPQDDAMVGMSKNGGVDFNPGKIKFQRQGVPVYKGNAVFLSHVSEADFSGLVPEIVRMASTTVDDFLR